MPFDRLDEIMAHGFLFKRVIEDAGPALHIWYEGPYRYATVGLASHAIGGHADDIDGATTAAGWSPLDHTNASYNTLGKIADAINAYRSAGWRCRIVGGLRSTDVGTDGDLIAASAASCLAKDGGVSLCLDSSAMNEAHVEVSGWDCYNDNHGVVVLLSSLSAAIAGTVMTGTAPRVYRCRGIAHADAEELVYQHPTDLTSGVRQTVPGSDREWGEAPLRGHPGDHFVIRWGAKDSSAFTGTSGTVTTEARYSVVGVGPALKYRSDR